MHGGEAYGARWDLLQGTHIAALNGAMDLLRPRLLVVSLLGKSVPQHLFQFVVDRAVQRREYLAVCFTAEDGEWKPWTFEGWGRLSPTSRGVSLGLTTVSLFGQSVRVVPCPRSLASGFRTLAFPRPGFGGAALSDIGLRGGADSTPEGIRSLPAGAGSAPAPPQPVPEMPLPDVRSGEDISPADRAKLDKEVESYVQEMEALEGQGRCSGLGFGPGRSRGLCPCGGEGH